MNLTKKMRSGIKNSYKTLTLATLGTIMATLPINAQENNNQNNNNNNEQNIEETIQIKEEQPWSGIGINLGLNTSINNAHSDKFNENTYFSIGLERIMNDVGIGLIWTTPLNQTYLGTKEEITKIPREMAGTSYTNIYNQTTQSYLYKNTLELQMNFEVRKPISLMLSVGTSQESIEKQIQVITHTEYQLPDGTTSSTPKTQGPVNTIKEMQHNTILGAGAVARYKNFQGNLRVMRTFGKQENETYLGVGVGVLIGSTRN